MERECEDIIRLSTLHNAATNFTEFEKVKIKIFSTDSYYLALAHVNELQWNLWY